MRHGEDVYEKLLDMGAPLHEHNISKDVFRTIPEIDKFKEPLDSG
jgi:hypothetical protein